MPQLVVHIQTILLGTYEMMKFVEDHSKHLHALIDPCNVRVTLTYLLYCSGSKKKNLNKVILNCIQWAHNGGHQNANKHDVRTQLHTRFYVLKICAHKI